MTKLAALLVIAAWLSISVWAWRQAPGARAADQFKDIWLRPWGKQFFVDFFGLETILAVWMLGDASAHGSWVAALACIATMPILGAGAAAAYWLLRG